ncbi:hypothetical protein [Burkholderia ubonensis]|uniref:hypothetical protein n=1 Tax=Burkholderia ubonensis TaxID=101571 RepID=UPI0012FBA507|nr:hypothetical protein [Burkholderia ubonensis]
MQRYVDAISCMRIELERIGATIWRLLMKSSEYQLFYLGNQMINQVSGSVVYKFDSPTLPPPVSSSIPSLSTPIQDAAATRPASTLDALQRNAIDAQPKAESAPGSVINESSATSEKYGFDLGSMLKGLTDFAKLIGEPLMELMKMANETLRSTMSMISSLGSSAMSMISSLGSSAMSIVKSFK